MEGIRSGPASQVLQVDGKGQSAANRIERVLEGNQCHGPAAGEQSMNTVVTINLNGNAYQVDENGYHALKEYLAGAETQLKDNPDRAEILADLEQAIADKCRRFLGPTKTVVTETE